MNVRLRRLLVTTAAAIVAAVFFLSMSHRRPAGRLRAWLARAGEDVGVILEKDPAVTNATEALLYPHLHALWIHRLANRLYRRGRRVPARSLAMLARFLSGIDIHPGASIGRRFFIDHGAGVVIGETARIGDDVMLYQQVTLGAVGWWKDMKRTEGAQRHPTIEDGVIIGANATVLGPITVGAGSKIGAHALVLDSLPANSRVLAHPGVVMSRTQGQPVDGVEAEAKEILSPQRQPEAGLRQP